MTRKPKPPTPAELEAQADAIIARNANALRRQAEMMRETRAQIDKLTQCYDELLQPRNDPAYMQALAARDMDRIAIANVIHAIHHIVEHGRTRALISFVDDKNKARCIEHIEAMGRHFEARILRQADPHDQTVAVDYTQSRTPKHEFGREKRSLKR